MTALYPVFLRVDRLRCVVIGGGAVAVRKVRGLLDADAHVTVVAPAVHPDLHRLVELKSVDWVPREARDDDLEGANLAFLATPDANVNARLEAVASKLGILVNRADSPDHGTFHVPAVVRRGDIAVGVSTGGRAPGIAQLVRDDIESVLTDERVALLDVVAAARKAARASGMSTNSTHWRDLLHDAALLSHVRAGQPDAAVQHILTRLHSESLARVPG
jgi:siroheme synthase-like protein